MIVVLHFFDVLKTVVNRSSNNCDLGSDLTYKICMGILWMEKINNKSNISVHLCPGSDSSSSVKNPCREENLSHKQRIVKEL